MLRLRRSLRLPGALAGLALAAGLLLFGCDSSDPDLADYQGHRPLDLLRVTQSFNPEVQWVGGRVAAVGVNRGSQAALDETLVWLRTAPDDDIGSFVTIGEGSDEGLVMQYGGTPADSLDDGETYTFWLADSAAFAVAQAAGLDSSLVEGLIEDGTFADTTFAMRLLFCGQSGGGAGATFEIERNERLTEERLLLRWTPASLEFRQLAIRQAAVGGFLDLTWHLVSPGEDPIIASPMTIGVTPEGVQEAIPFVDFERDDEWTPPELDSLDTSPPTYFLWATTDEWNESFAPNAPGYAWFRIDRRSLDIDDPCP